MKLGAARVVLGIATGSLVFACVSAPIERDRVAVYQAPLGGPASDARMPAGCRLLMSHPPVDMTELEMTGSKDPFHIQREGAAAAGGNMLLARSRILVPRRDFNCPAASPITDCPPSDGAWFEVVFEDYACSADGLQQLRTSAPIRP